MVQVQWNIRRAGKEVEEQGRIGCRSAFDEFIRLVDQFMVLMRELICFSDEVIPASRRYFCFDEWW